MGDHHSGTECPMCRNGVVSETNNGEMECSNPSCESNWVKNSADFDNCENSSDEKDKDSEKR